MRDIPIFLTENGVGSLFLHEVPSSEIAYIRIGDASQPEAYLQECISFCRGVGARTVYACGHTCLERYAMHTKILRMTCDAENLPDTDAALFPVTDRTLERWLEIYNQKMKLVANAAYMTWLDGKKRLQTGDAYFVHRGDRLLGIGIASGDRIDAVASVYPGAGKDVVLALKNALSARCIYLEVASVNRKAVSLYEQLGFICTNVVSVWYHVL